MKIPLFLKDSLKGLLDLVYPRTCAACGEEAPIDNGVFCLHCMASLSYSDSHMHQENEFTQQFWGRVPLSFGASMLYIIPGGLTEHLIHQIKYKKRREFAVEIGKWYAERLLSSPIFDPPDLIIPVPLHPRKLHLRGYNQSEAFGQGLSEVLDIQMDRGSLIRNRFTRTQTKKNRLQRLDNMQDAFSLKFPNRIRGKHILLVDDVLTTGATLEACGLNLIKESVKLSMATIAMGRI